VLHFQDVTSRDDHQPALQASLENASWTVASSLASCFTEAAGSIAGLSCVHPLRLMHGPTCTRPEVKPDLTTSTCVMCDIMGCTDGLPSASLANSLVSQGTTSCSAGSGKAATLTAQHSLGFAAACTWMPACRLLLTAYVCSRSKKAHHYDQWHTPNSSRPFSFQPPMPNSTVRCLAPLASTLVAYLPGRHAPVRYQQSQKVQ
jgi:hypothetical protein